MKEIQDYLGHADFATTANTYSHLDFSTKIQSANTIFNALAPEPNQRSSEYSSLDFLEQTYVEMQKYGFNNLDDYFYYLKNQLPNSFSQDINTEKKRTKQKTSGYEI